MSSLNIEYTLYLTGNKVLRNGENQPYIKMKGLEHIMK